MPLHPDSVAFLEALAEWRAENGYSTWDVMGAERSRPVIREAIAAGKPPMAAMARVENRTIPARSGRRPCRIFTPPADGPLPVALYFHGGGYVIGGIDESEHEARRIAATDARGGGLGELSHGTGTPLPGGGGGRLGCAELGCGKRRRARR